MYPAAKKERWAEMYLAGDSTKTIAAKEDVSGRTVYLHLVATGVRLRPVGRKKVFPGATKADHARRANLKKYGITEDQYGEMLREQDGRCAICREQPDGVGKTGKVLHVDHDHKTGAVRGLLCRDCNPALGAFRDSPELLRRAAEYLEKR